MVDVAFTHPEMVRRWETLVALCWERGCEVWISSSTRSYATQKDLYQRWLAGTYNTPYVANPDRLVGESPWGWNVYGSYHMIQADGYSHALDLGHRGVSNDEFEGMAVSCGLVRTVPREFWHRQWFSKDLVFAAPAVPSGDEQEDDDVQWSIVRPADGPSEWYPNGHPLVGAWYAANNLNMAYHLRTEDETARRKFFGAQTAPDGGAIQLPHDWFDGLFIMTGNADTRPVQVRPY